MINISSNLKERCSGIEEELECQIINLTQSMPDYIEALNNIILKLNSEPNWLEATIKIFFSAFAGALAAYLFTKLNTVSTRESENFSSIIDGLKESVKELESHSVSYWLESSNNPKSPKEVGTELKIKGLLTVIRRMSAVAQKPLKKRSLRNIADALETFHSEMFDLITGGNFESSSREKSEVVASKISAECSKMIARISSLKYWV